MPQQGRGQAIDDIYVSIRLEADKLKADLKKLPGDAEKISKQIEESFKRRKIYINNALAKKSMKELLDLRKKLETRFDRQLKLNASSAGLKSTVDQLKSVNNAVDNLNSKGKNIGSGIGAGFKSLALTAGIAYFAISRIFGQIGKLIKAANNQAEAEYQVSAAIKQTGYAAGFTASQLIKQASALQKLTGVGDEEILKGVTNQLLTFKQLSGDAFTRAQKLVLDLNSVIAKGELGSLSSQAIQLGKALNDPEQGLSALRRVGISFSDEQVKIIKNLISQNKLYDAQSIILTEIESQYGGQAEALNKATRGTKDFAATWGDVNEGLGEFIINVPGVQELLNGLTSGFRKWIEIFQGTKNLFGLGTFKSSLVDLEDLAQQVTLNELKTSTAASREELKKWHMEQINILNDQGELNKVQQKQLAIHKSSLEAIKIYEGQLKVANKEWTVQGKTVGEIQDKITELTDSLNNLSPDLDAQKIKEVRKEIADLNKKIADDESNKQQLIDLTIQKVQNEAELTKLYNRETFQTLQIAKENLAVLLNQNLSKEDQLKVLQAMEQIDKRILELETNIENKRSKASPVGPDLEGANKFLESRKDALAKMDELTSKSIDNEFAQREAEINKEYELLAAKLQEYYDNHIINEMEFQDASKKLEVAKEIEISKLQQQRFSAGLGAARGITSALGSIVGSSSKFVENLNKALDIAEAIVALIQALQVLGTLFGGPVGALAALKEGGNVTNGKVIPYNRIPRYQSGVTGIVPQKYQNDSYLMRVSAGEKVSVTPANRAGDSDRLLAVIANRIGVLSYNVQRLKLQVAVVNQAPGVKTQVIKQEKVKKDLRISGKNFDER